MLKYGLKRLVSSVPTFFIILTVVFFMIRLVPGGPFDSEKKIPDVLKQNLEKKYHLDEPLWKQYFRYVGDVVFRFDLGPSFHYRGWSVNDLIGRSLPVSLLIGTLAIILALILGILSGIISALKQNTFLDYLFMSISIFGISMPLFLIAPLLILLLARWLHLVPVGGWGMPSQLIIPALALSLPYTAYIARLTKAGMLENMRKDFVMTARSKGLPETTILFRHVLKGSLIPVISFLGPAYAGIVTGSMIVEEICNIPGMGRDFVQAAFNRDYTLIAGVLLVYSLLLIFMNLLVDLIYALLDPRIRYR
jgi:oligopeptide transport system permease protein